MMGPDYKLLKTPDLILKAMGSFVHVCFKQLCWATVHLFSVQS